MHSKNEDAKVLAQKHYEVEPEITEIYRLKGSPQIDLTAQEQIILLEVNPNTVPLGIMPLQFGAAPEIGIHFPSVIIEVTPEEFAKIETHELTLPFGWSIDQLIPRGGTTTS